ncbi:MAG: HAD-IIIC family phosphatase [Verrucomicrobiae bacterium]|nr:HAD-IIIC family phosphatase [Verrucomicrobiae bacterium]
MVREHVVERLENLIDGIRKNSSAPIFLWNMAEPARLAAGFADASLEFSEQQFVAEVNQGISGLCRRSQNTWIFDFHRTAYEVGLKHFYDLRLSYLARMPFSQRAQAHLARNHARCFALLKMRPKKCLVLDLDNTLWGGVVGEDGLSGIELGEDYPGSAYVDFQRYLARLRNRGILLAIASKNNEKDALDVLTNHPSSILRPEDFSELQIHWKDKALSIRNIAANLNIALDSITFFDDNPAEREWVKSQLPEVHVFDTGTNPIGYVDVIESSGLFDTLVLTPEDTERADHYRIERQRRISSRSFENPEDFLRSLDTIISHELLDTESPQFRRVLQLLGRSNQFNLTTRRHTADELRRLLEAGGIGVTVSVSDRFGSHGLVGFALAVPPSGHDSKEDWRIDTFLLSCRVMGRRIESALLRLLVDRVRGRARDVAIIGEYIPTPKNSPSRNFYPEHAFEKIDESATQVRYLLDSSRIPELPDLYSLKAE